MATSPEYAAHVCALLEGAGHVRSRKMFGEYMVYVNDKPLLLVCDNTVYAKMLPALEGLMRRAQQGPSYPGAKDHWLVDMDTPGLLQQVVDILEPLTPVPRPRRKKA